jgi:hypothetical protein
MVAELDAALPETMKIGHELMEKFSGILYPFRKDGRKAELVHEKEEDVGARPGNLCAILILGHQFTYTHLV